MRRWSRRAALSAVGSLTFAGAGGVAGQEIVRPASLGPSVPPELYRPDREWPTAQGDLAATRVARSATIDASSVAELVEAWSFPVEASTGYGGMTATPIVSGDVVFLQDMLSNVFALDRRTGEVRWTRTYDVPCIGPNGLALGYGLLVGALGDSAEVVALDAVTGAERWRVQLSNNRGEGIDMAPLIYDSTVYVSTVAGNTASFNRGGTRGVLFALDAGTGATLWQFDTTIGNLWGNPRVNSGGGLWYPPSTEGSGLYFGTGNAAPWPGTPDFPNGSSRPAPNDYASSAVALEIGTGAVRWHYNAAPLDLLDHDFQNTPVLVDLQTANGARPLAVCSGKTGTVVAIERTSGEVVWERAVGRHQNNELRALPEEPLEIFPGAWGGVLTPLACTDGHVFVPIVNHGTRYFADGFDKESMFTLTEATGALACLSLTEGSVLWEAAFDTPMTAGATVVNDLIMVAGLDGLIRFVNTFDGRLVHQIWAGAGVNACPAVAGDQIFVAAAGPFIPSSHTAELDGQQSTAKVTCYTIG